MDNITIEDVFSTLEPRFRADKAGDYETIFHFDFKNETGDNSQFTVKIGQGVCKVEKGLNDTPKCAIKSKSQTYVDLTLGKGNPQMAVMSGKIKVTNIAEMLKFAPLFAKFSTDYISKNDTATQESISKNPSRKPNSGPLVGLKIIDLTRLLPGPLATMMLADMGAEVIKVESPNFYDYARDFPPHRGGESAGYLAFNRSKRSLSLDYAQDEGKKILLELIQTADVFIEQFRPGVMEKMGLGYDYLKSIHPNLIYISITGYGHTGPYSQLAGHDLNYISYAGILGNNQKNPPQMPLIQMADIAGGSYMTVNACLAALFARQKTGKGQFVDVSMMDAVMPLTVNSTALYWATSESQAREDAFLSGGLINYNIYPTQDKKYMALGTLEEKFWFKFCEAVQKPDWKNRMFSRVPAEFEAYKRDVKTLFESHTQSYWIELGLQHDLLLSPVYDTSEIENDPQIKAREMVVEQDHPTAGKVKTIGVPIKFSETKAQAHWPAPLLGEDSYSILKELNKTEEEIQELTNKKVIS